jgi:hypothetical protein
VQHKDTSDYFAPGDRIRIVSGPFAGLSGILTHSTPACCILKLDSWPEGVYIELAATAIAPLSSSEG